MKYRKMSIVIEATRWFKNGDHPKDNARSIVDSHGDNAFWGEGNVVKYLRSAHPSPDTLCSKCDRSMREHGWIDTLEGGYIVCPGDWIITGVKGERYPCKDDIFRETYEHEDGTPV